MLTTEVDMCCVFRKVGNYDLARKRADTNVLRSSILRSATTTFSEQSCRLTK